MKKTGPGHAIVSMKIKNEEKFESSLTKTHYKQPYDSNDPRFLLRNDGAQETVKHL